MPFIAHAGGVTVAVLFECGVKFFPLSGFLVPVVEGVGGDDGLTGEIVFDKMAGVCGGAGGILFEDPRTEMVFNFFFHDFS